MSAVIGSFLIMLGTFGFSMSICMEYRMRLILLKRIRDVYEYMEFQISYGKLPIPEIFNRSLEGLPDGWRRGDRIWP